MFFLIFVLLLLPFYGEYRFFVIKNNSDYITACKTYVANGILL